MHGCTSHGAERHNAPISQFNFQQNDVESRMSLEAVMSCKHHSFFFIKQSVVGKSSL